MVVKIATVRAMAASADDIGRLAVAVRADSARRQGGGGTPEGGSVGAVAVAVSIGDGHRPTKSGVAASLLFGSHPTDSPEADQNTVQRSSARRGSPGACFAAELHPSITNPIMMHI